MTLDEAQAEVEKITGERIPIGTLRRWASEELIPKPTKLRAAGPKGGIAGDWPLDTPAQIVATRAALRYVGRPSREDVRQARDIALKQRTDPHIFDGDLMVKATLPDGTSGYHFGGRLQPLIVTWGCTFAKVLYGQPWDKPADVAYVYYRNGDEGDLVRLDEPRFTECYRDTLGLSFERPDLKH